MQLFLSLIQSNSLVCLLQVSTVTFTTILAASITVIGGLIIALINTYANSKSKNKEYENASKAKDKEYENVIKTKDKEYENALKTKDKEYDNLSKTKNTDYENDYYKIVLAKRISVYGHLEEQIAQLAGFSKDKLTKQKRLAVFYQGWAFFKNYHRNMQKMSALTWISNDIITILYDLD